MSQEFATYYMLCFVLSMLLLCDIESKQPHWANMTGNFIASMFGFIMWPLFLYAWVRYRYY
jgi:hypothetical protein